MALAGRPIVARGPKLQPDEVSAMDQDKAPCASRRDALKLGLGVAAGAMAVGSAFAQPARLSKEAVKYTDSGNVEGKDCDDCSQFVPGRSAGDMGTCKI